MKKFAFLILACFIYSSTTAQDTLKLSQRSFDTSAFAGDDTLTHSDYLLEIGKVFKTLNRAPFAGQFVASIEAINSHMDEDDSALAIIKERVSGTDRGLNIRNLQMYDILLGQLSDDNKEYDKKLNRYDSILDAIKKDIYLVRKDSVLRVILKNRSLLQTFKPQMFQFYQKWKTADSIIKHVNILVDETLARISTNLITTDELQRLADALLKTTGPRAFSKERRYLWEPRSTNLPASRLKGLAKVLSDEKKVTKFYFGHTRNQLYLLLFTGLVFFYWVAYNFRSLKRLDKLNALDPFMFRYVNPLPVTLTLVLMLNLAPLFDLDAPAIYIESIEFLLMLTLTALLRKQLPVQIFYMWIVYVLLFVILSVTRLLDTPFYVQRWATLCINTASCILGLFAIFRLKRHARLHRILFIVAGIFIFFNMAAIVCNLFGRVTLTQILDTTAFAALVQVIGLMVFVKLIIEAFLLQIQGSRVRKQYPWNFEYADIAKGLSRLFSFLATIIWLIVFTTNLNLYAGISNALTAFLTLPRYLGSISYTLSGVILFLAIIWMANFLQKYIAYFFGDVGDDAAFDNKGQRSRLLITRLVLLISGFLLAVAASGLPIDKITVIVGALGIGIGLGLQNIVNNFVSGIILIFDRPLRIGDTVEIGDKKGRVKEISVRSSTLLTPDGAEVIIPNGDILSHNIVNWTLSNSHIRIDLTFGISQFISTDEIKEPIQKIIQSFPEVLTAKMPEIFINTMKAQSAELKVYFWCKDIAKSELTRSEVYAAIYKYLEEKDIKVL